MKLERIAEEFKNGTGEIVAGAVLIAAGIALESSVSNAMLGGFIAGGGVMIDGFRRFDNSTLE